MEWVLNTAQVGLLVLCPALKAGNGKIYIYMYTYVCIYIYPYTHIYILYIYTFQHVNGNLIEQNGGFSSKKQYLITRGHIKSH